jgi:hypothetical protein
MHKPIAILSLITALVLLCCISCGGSKAQFFVFPENQRMYHNQNVIRSAFPGWDIDIALMSPQGDYWYNTCATCSDYKYHLTIHNICRSDSISVWNLESRGWGALRIPEVANRIAVDSVRLSFLPGGKSVVLFVDSLLFTTQPKHQLPGIRYEFDPFKIPSGTDSLRMQFEAVITDSSFSAVDSVLIDTVLYRWIRPEKKD